GEFGREDAAARRPRVGEDDELIEIVAVRLVELSPERDEVDLLLRSEPLADGAAAARDWRARGGADVDGREDAGGAGRHAHDRRCCRNRGSVDEVDGAVGADSDLHIHAARARTEFGHVAPGDGNRVAVDPAVYAAAARRIEVI